MSRRIHSLGVASAIVLAILWTAFLAAIVGFGEGMGGATPSISDYSDIFLWPGALGYAAAMALALAAWKHRAGAWTALALALLATGFIGWLLI